MSALRRVANVVEIVVLVAVVVTVVLLFTNSPTKAPVAPAAATGDIDAAALYGRNCAGCHGGDGSGGIGPRLAGRVVVRFPDAAEQIAVVSDGRGGMPAFSDRLSEDQIAAIVEYTRTTLSGNS